MCAASPSGPEAAPKRRGAKRPSTSLRLAMPPAPWAISICGSRNLILLAEMAMGGSVSERHRVSDGHGFVMLIVVVSRAGAFRRNHQGADRCLRCAFAAEEFALRGFEDALENLAALRGVGIRNTHAGDREALLGVPIGVGRANLESRLRDEPEAAPLEIRPKLENFGHSAKRGAVAIPGNHALVLVFNLGLAAAKLAKKHDDRLENIEGLEAGDDDGFAFVLGDPLIGAAADDRRNVTGADKAVEAHVGRIEYGADRRNDGDVIRKDGEVADPLELRAEDGESSGRRGGFKTDGEKHDLLFGIHAGKL